MNFKRLIALVLFAGCSMLSPALRSEMVETKGIGEVYYDRVFGINAKDEQKALRLAEVDAVNRVMADSSSARRAEYEKVRSSVEANIEQYVKVARVLDETKDTAQKRYAVTIRAEVDTGLLEKQIARASAVSSADPGKKGTLTFIFMSRKEAAVRQFDERRTVRTDKSHTEEGKESQASSEGKESARSEASTSDTTTTGGSTEIKSDQIKYEVRSSEDINNTVTRVFSDAGFEVTEAEMVQDETNGKMSLDAFRADYSSRPDVSAETRKNAALGCKQIPIRYMVVGSLDIGQNLRDPASGLVKVFVSVNAKVYDIPPLPPARTPQESQEEWDRKANKGPRTVATIGPVQYSGLGPTQSVAERNALILAGESAAGELVSQMRAKNLF